MADEKVISRFIRANSAFILKSFAAVQEQPLLVKLFGGIGVLPISLICMSFVIVSEIIHCIFFPKDIGRLVIIIKDPLGHKDKILNDNNIDFSIEFLLSIGRFIDNACKKQVAKHAKNVHIDAAEDLLGMIGVEKSWQERCASSCSYI